MSVINQVLNQLERRGAHTAAAQPMVRTVQQNRRNLTLPLLATGLTLIAGIAAWQWVSSPKPAVMVVNVAPKAVSPPISSEPEKLVQQKQTIVPASGIPAVVPPAALPLPVSRLSFELSSVPLPYSLKTEENNHVANPAQAPKSGTSAQGSSKRAHPVPVAKAKTKVVAQVATDAVPMKQVSSAQRADAEFRRAVMSMQQGRIADAIAGYESALRLDAGHEAARQALVALMLEGKRNADAEKVLLEGLNSKPEQTGFTMLLARLQVERGAILQATATLEKSLPFAETQAEYRAFLAALLQRQNRNEEAIAHYQIVLQHAPDNGVWLMGYGISLQAVQRNAEAKDAFKRALDTQTLSPELQSFVQQKIKGL